jgi:hypothetical protein
MYTSTFTCRKPTLTTLGTIGLLKVSIIVLVSCRLLFRLIRILRTAVTPSFFMPSTISLSLTPARSRQRMTPFDVLSVEWVDQVTGIS